MSDAGMGGTVDKCSGDGVGTGTSFWMWDGVEMNCCPLVILFSSTDSSPVIVENATVCPVDLAVWTNLLVIDNHVFYQI